MMKKGKLMLVLCMLSAFALATPLMAADQIVLKLGHGGAVTDPRQTASETFAKVASEKSGGKVKVEIYPASALGTWREMQEGLELGTCDIVIEDIGTLQRYSEFCALGFMPFVYRDKAHFEKVWNSPLADEILTEVRKKTGFQLIGVMYRGGRDLTAVRPCRTLADLKGLKIRVPNAEVSILTWKDLGASPTPMAFTEVFGALQQKVIDAQENPLDVIFNDSIHEVAPYITLSNHVIGAFNFQFWGKKFDNFPKEVQDALKAAANAAGKEYTENTTRREQEILAKYKADAKVTLITLDPAEYNAWKAQVAPVYDKYPELKPYLEKINNLK
jgi:tripartite ATP-independent transporter DctP family solute receptor